MATTYGSCITHLIYGRRAIEIDKNTNSLYELQSVKLEDENLSSPKMSDIFLSDILFVILVFIGLIGFLFWVTWHTERGGIQQKNTCRTFRQVFSTYSGL